LSSGLCFGLFFSLVLFFLSCCFSSFFQAELYEFEVAVKSKKKEEMKKF